VANSIIFNDIDLSSEDYGLTIRKGAYPQASQARVNTLDLAQQHGGVNQGGKRTQMSLTLSGVVIGTTYADLRDKMDRLAYLLNPNNGDKHIKLDHIPNRYYIGRLTSPIMPPTAGVTALSLDLTFSVQPTAYATDETVQTVTIDETPEAFTVPASGTVSGNIEAVPVWQIQNTNAGTVTSVTLTNTTNSQTITLAQSIPQNHYIRFDAARMFAEYSTDGSTWVSAMANMSTTNKIFPNLKPRVANSCSVTGVTDGVLTITYKPRY